jgi:long-chain acyl-CoA synthetase
VERPWVHSYEDGVPTDVPPCDHPVTQNLVAAAERFPDRNAMVFGSVVAPLGNILLDRGITYAATLSLTRRFAAGLHRLGVRQGDRVAIHLPNCPQFPVSYYATLMLGAIAVPCNPTYVARELQHQLTDSGAETIVTLSLTYPLVRAVRESTPLKHIVVTNVKEYFPTLLRLLFTAAMEKKEGHQQDTSGHSGTLWFHELLSNSSVDLPEPDIDLGDTAVLMYTGGTTGVPKAAQLTHANLQANAQQVRVWLTRLVEGQEVIMTSLPLFHSYGMTTCMNLGFATGSTLVLITDPRSLPHILRSIKRHHPTLYPGVPAMYVAINNHPDIERFDCSSIWACISGAAPLPAEVQQRFQALTEGRLVEGFGLSEASPVTHANPIYGENRIGTIGLPFPSTDAKITDAETGTRELPPGELGELLVRGPQVMSGYWNRPDETAHVLHDGWLSTGDLATMDADGYFRIIDRKKDMILGAGGFNVYPREIEDVLYEHPKVKAAAVVGVPVRDKGERAKAFIVLKEGTRASEQELIEFCRANLARYKVPRYVEFRDELPTTMVGKVLRRVLLEEELAQAQA